MKRHMSQSQAGTHAGGAFSYLSQDREIQLDGVWHGSGVSPLISCVRGLVPSPWHYLEVMEPLGGGQEEVRSLSVSP
jgi:hypothetical protein